MLGIQYVFPKGKIRPSFAIGPEIDYSFKLDLRETVEKVSASEVRTYEEIGGFSNYGAFGGFAQAGLEFLVNSKQRILLQFRYRFTMGTTELILPSTVFENLSYTSYFLESTGTYYESSDMSYGTYPMYFQGFSLTIGYFFF